MRLIKLVLIAITMLSCIPMRAQHALYSNQFDLKDIVLLPSVFKTTQDKNYQLLLEYDTDRLLTPYIRQSGLSKTSNEKSRYFQWEYEHPVFPNFAWNPTLAMDGHLTGHYLSALSLAYASCKDPVMKGKLKERIDYIIVVLKDCQNVFNKDDKGLKGFLGGIPDNEIWTSLYSGDYRVYNLKGNWVPLYCAHKIMAGLRDAYIYANVEEAKDMFKKMCDWAIELVHLFSDDIMEMQILQWEPGGINEVLADAFHIFNDAKYMKAAEKYSHQIMIENMNGDVKNDFLDNKHANESITKFVGFARIDEVHSDSRYEKASRAFWNNVSQRRSSVIGGPGVNSYFQPHDQMYRFVEEGDGPETCSAYNMMKLTERLFSNSRNPRYSEYYEKILVNQMLGNYDPQTGGYCYHTSLRPESYRIYSKSNEAMWCCVGTGMETASKFGEFIYTMSSDTLFVNLFIASELNDRRFSVKQETEFPYGNKSKITVKQGGNYSIAVRHPGWTNTGYNITVNGKAPRGFHPEELKRGTMKYISCGKAWKAGDVIEVTYPMAMGISPCPGSTYLAFNYGPIVLAAITSSTDKASSMYEVLANEYAGEGRRDNSPAAKMKSKNLAYAPMLICEKEELPSRIKMKDASTLTFTMDATAPGSPWTDVELQPFFKIHHQRYSVYMNHQTKSAFLRSPLYASELKTRLTDEATFDKIDLGVDASEKGRHFTFCNDVITGGAVNDIPYRDCQPDHWFEFDMNCEKAAASIQSARDSITLLCRFYAPDRGRQCEISIDGEQVARYMIPSNKAISGKNKFFEQPVQLPAWAIQGKKKIRVRYAASNGFSPKLFYVRLLKNDKTLF